MLALLDPRGAIYTLEAGQLRKTDETGEVSVVSSGDPQDLLDSLQELNWKAKKAGIEVRMVAPDGCVRSWTTALAEVLADLADTLAVVGRQAQTTGHALGDMKLEADGERLLQGLQQAKLLAYCLAGTSIAAWIRAIDRIDALNDRITDDVRTITAGFARLN